MDNSITRNQLVASIRDELKLNKKTSFCQYYLSLFKNGFPLEAVIVISKLLDWEGKQSDTSNFYIYKTIKEMTEETGLSRYRQDKAFSLLKAFKLIEVVNKGWPRKRHILLNLFGLMAIIFGNSKLTKKKNSFNLFNSNT